MMLAPTDPIRDRSPGASRRGEVAPAFRTLGATDALLVLLLCAVSITFTRHIWSSTVFALHPLRAINCVVLGLSGAIWLAWVRRFRWISCSVEHRWIGVAGFALAFFLIRSNSPFALLSSIGVVLTVFSAVIVVMGAQAALRFLPVISVVGLTVLLPNLEAFLRVKYPQMESFGLLGTFVRLAPSAILLAHVLAFATPLYAGVRAATVLVSPVVTLVASAMWALIEAPLQHFNYRSIVIDLAGSELVALLAMFVTFAAALWMMRRAMIPTGPFSLARSASLGAGRK